MLPAVSPAVEIRRCSSASLVHPLMLETRILPSPWIASAKRNGSSPFSGPMASSMPCADFSSMAPQSMADCASSVICIAPTALPTSELMRIESCPACVPTLPRRRMVAMASAELPSSISTIACARRRRAASRTWLRCGRSSSNPLDLSSSQSQRFTRAAASNCWRTSAVRCRIPSRRARCSSPSGGLRSAMNAWSSAARSGASVPYPAALNAARQSGAALSCARAVVEASDAARMTTTASVRRRIPAQWWVRRCMGSG